LLITLGTAVCSNRIAGAGISPALAVIREPTPNSPKIYTQREIPAHYFSFGWPRNVAQAYLALMAASTSSGVCGSFSAKSMSFPAAST
jgi:hypothetical protein